MKKKLLVIVDMVNGFVNMGALHDPYINHITEGIKDLALQNIKEGNDAITFRDCHSLIDEEFKTFPVHCLVGSEESKLVPELKFLESIAIDIPKNTTNGFQTEKFQKFYEENFKKYDEIIVVGCCTDICVTDFTTSLMNFHKKNKIDTKVTVFVDLVETFDAVGHERSIMNEIGLEKMRRVGVYLERKEIKKEKNYKR